MIAEVLAEGSVAVPELTVIACGVGPGPYTGLRVGLATAVAMSAALGIPVVGVCSLDVIAEQGRTSTDLPLLVATDARRREVYAAAYADGRRVLGPVVLPPSDAADAARTVLDGHNGASAHGDATVMAVGSGSLLYHSVLVDCGVVVAEGEPGAAYPDAGVLATMVVDHGAAAVDAAAMSTSVAVLDHARGSGVEGQVPLGLLPPRPLYLRRPDAAEPAR